MSLPHDLLEQANHLASREKKRPKQASLRRSISTSYYALFHLLIQDATGIIGPNMKHFAREGMARWFNHGEMKRVCNFFSAATAPTNKDAPRQLSSILGAPVSEDLQTVAMAFIQLQEARHDADCNLTKTWTRLTAQQHVKIAREAFEAWARLKKSHEANVFAITLISIKLFDKER
jgi:hypothetical protein